MRFNRSWVVGLTLGLMVALLVLAACAPAGGADNALTTPGGGELVGTPADELGTPMDELGTPADELGTPTP